MPKLLTPSVIISIKKYDFNFLIVPVGFDFYILNKTQEEGDLFARLCTKLLPNTQKFLPVSLGDEEYPHSMLISHSIKACELLASIALFIAETSEIKKILVINSLVGASHLDLSTTYKTFIIPFFLIETNLSLARNPLTRIAPSHYKKEADSWIEGLEERLNDENAQNPAILIMKKKLQSLKISYSTLATPVEFKEAPRPKDFYGRENYQELDVFLLACAKDINPSHSPISLTQFTKKELFKKMKNLNDGERSLSTLERSRLWNCGLDPDTDLGKRFRIKEGTFFSRECDDTRGTLADIHKELRHLTVGGSAKVNSTSSNFWTKKSATTAAQEDVPDIRLGSHGYSIGNADL